MRPLGVFHQEKIVFRLPSITPYMVRRQNFSCRSCFVFLKYRSSSGPQQILRKMFSLLHSWLHWYLPEKSCHLLADSSINNSWSWLNWLIIRRYFVLRSFTMVQKLWKRQIRASILNYKPHLGCISLGKVLIRILVMAKSRKGLRIQWIRARRRFNGLIRIRILRIHDFCVSLGKDSKKVHVVSGLNKKQAISCTDIKIRFWIFRFFRRD